MNVVLTGSSRLTATMSVLIARDGLTGPGLVRPAEQPAGDRLCEPIHPEARVFDPSLSYPSWALTLPRTHRRFADQRCRGSRRSKLRTYRRRYGDLSTSSIALARRCQDGCHANQVMANIDSGLMTRARAAVRLGGMAAQIGYDRLNFSGDPRPALLAAVARVQPEPGREWVNLEKHLGFRSTQRLKIGDSGDGVVVATWPAEKTCLRHPPTVAGLTFLCLETRHADVLKLNTAIPTRSELCGSPWRPPTARATVGQRLLAALKRTSMASRKPSPMKLKPTTTATMQSPAGQICHQYPANV